MSLTQEQKKQFKSIGHHLKPIVTVAENGLTEGVLAELDRALNDHELIKIQLRLAEREDRKVITDELCQKKVAVFWYKASVKLLLYIARTRNRTKTYPTYYATTLSLYPSKPVRSLQLYRWVLRPGMGCSTNSTPHIPTAK